MKKYSFVISESYGWLHKYKFKNGGLTLKEHIPFIGDGFHKGIDVFRLYENGRNTKTFIEIKKENFSPEFNEECYINCKKDAEKKRLQNRIDMKKEWIIATQKEIDKLEHELNTL
jgi:hypothetical protein